MTNEQYIFLLFIGRIIIPSFYFTEPAKIRFVPICIPAFQRRTRPATRNKNIVAHVRHFILQPHIKFIADQIKIVCFSVCSQDFPDTTHALVGFAFIEVEDRYFYLLSVINHAHKHNKFLTLTSVGWVVYLLTNVETIS